MRQSVYGNTPDNSPKLKGESWELVLESDRYGGTMVRLTEGMSYQTLYLDGNQTRVLVAELNKWCSAETSEGEARS